MRFSTEGDTYMDCGSTIRARGNLAVPQLCEGGEVKRVLAKSVIELEIIAEAAEQLVYFIDTPIAQIGCL